MTTTTSSARERIRPTIKGPDGRIYTGMRKDDVSPNKETPYCVALADMLGGVLEVTLPAGRADVATETKVFEVESVGSWRKGAQQAFAYAGMTGLVPALALFGRTEYRDVYLEVRDKMPNLELWVWRSGAWVHATSLETAGVPEPRGSHRPVDAPVPVSRQPEAHELTTARGYGAEDPELVRWREMTPAERLAENPCEHGGVHESKQDAAICALVRCAPPITGELRSFLRVAFGVDAPKAGRPS